MQIIVQEGEILVSLITAIQAPDENLRTMTVQIVTGPGKVYYRDLEVVRVEVREGALEILPAAIGSLAWLKKGRRYQLKIGGEG
ncbi:MAG: hypothetical protein GX113_04785 [Actinobacteria bacterium]|jgi:hypothetical protein|nr:hypothetical protein [Actinomycetota bacterium]